MKEYLYNLATDKDKSLTGLVIKPVLYLASLFYLAAVVAAEFLYRKNILRGYRSGAKVISIGNITLGGTGKTPLVELLATYLKDAHHKVSVLTRGYKKSGKSKNIPGGPEDMGDEPYMLLNNVPGINVLVGRNRITNAKLAYERFNSDTIILDDGFQHWRLKRDLDLVTIDMDNPFGNRSLLPRGILREPISSLKRGDIFVITKNNADATPLFTGELKKINQKALVVEAVRRPIGLFSDYKEIQINEIKTNIICVLCGIANPKSFFDMVSSLGLKAAINLSFSDHHNYSRADIEDILTEVRKNNADTVITTQKDFVKLQKYQGLFGGIKLLYLKIRLDITKNKEEFYGRISALYNR